MRLGNVEIKLNKDKSKEEKLEFLRTMGYAVFSKVPEVTKEMLDVKIKEAGINISEFKGEDETKYSYYRIVDDGISGEVQRYTLDCYGNLVYITYNDSPAEDDVILYYGGNEYRLDGYEYPDVSYVLYDGKIIYAGCNGGTARILEMVPNDYEVRSQEHIKVDVDMEDYLINFLVNHEENKMLKNGFIPTSHSKEDSEATNRFEATNYFKEDNKMEDNKMENNKMEDNNAAMFIDNLNDYVLDLVLNGESVVRAKKNVLVKARQGKVGEIVETEIDKTTNTVKVDEKGNPDWIITSIGGEEYIVRNEVFTSTYDKFSEGMYIKNKLQLLVYCNKTVEFVPSWGGTFTVEKGGYFTINGHNDIAGIQSNAFKETYEVVSNSNEDRLEVIKILEGSY